MSGKNQTAQLRKENKELKRQLNETKEQVNQLSQAIHDSASNGESEENEKVTSVEYISKQYDDMEAFRKQASLDIKRISANLEKIEKRCNEISDCIEEMQDYSYQYNIKIMGMPVRAAKENSETTANLCLQLFHCLGVKDISIQDIDIAHRVRPRRPSDRPDAIICKFVRRMVKEKVMAARGDARKLTTNDLGFEDHISLTYLGLYDHLSPRLQNLLHEAKLVKADRDYKFCWAKNGAVFLRKSEVAPIIKIRDLKHLTDLQDDS